MTMMVPLSRVLDAGLEPLFMVLQNRDTSFPICGVPDDVSGVTYRSGLESWMDRAVMIQYMKESRAIRKLE